MGKRRIYDEDVHEVFKEYGLQVAIYFEAIRYRQQLHKGELFPFKREDITKKTGLSFKQQRRAREVLESTGWIKTARARRKDGGTVTCYIVTELASKVIAQTVRDRKADLAKLKAEKLLNVYAQGA